MQTCDKAICRFVTLNGTAYSFKLLTDEHIFIAHSPVLTAETVIELQRCFNRAFEFRVLAQAEFEILLARAYETGTEAAMAAYNRMDVDLSRLVSELPPPEDLLESGDDAPIIRLLNAILTQAIKQKASDIHFETFEDQLVVRFRCDGVLREILQPATRIIATCDFTN